MEEFENHKKIAMRVADEVFARAGQKVRYIARLAAAQGAIEAGNKGDKAEAMRTA